MNTLSEVLRRTYDRIAEADEGPQFSFRPNVDCHETEAYCRLMHDSRKRDQMIGATQRGPHRDDFNFSLQIGSAREYASDGQQRGLCVALRIAQPVFTDNSSVSCLYCWRTMCSASSIRLPSRLLARLS